MWTCADCGERHDDHFQICWKCAGGELAESVEALPTMTALPQEPRELRPFSSIVVRAIIAFVIGTVVGIAFFQRQPGNTEPVAAGVLFGLGVGAVVGLFIWVCFPYEPKGRAKSPVIDEDVDVPNGPTG